MKKLKPIGVILIISGCLFSLISYFIYDGYVAMMFLIIGVLLFIAGIVFTPKIRKIIGFIVEIFLDS